MIHLSSPKCEECSAEIEPYSSIPLCDDCYGQFYCNECDSELTDTSSCNECATSEYEEQ